MVMIFFFVPVVYKTCLLCIKTCSQLFLESEHSSFSLKFFRERRFVSHSTETLRMIQLPQNTQKLLRGRQTKEAARSLDVSHGIF